MRTKPKVSRYQAIADELAADIHAGTHPLGSQLPAEHDLAQYFDTSRQTVREALRVLADKGMIMRRAGCGTTVINTDARALFTLSPGNLGQLLSYPEGVVRRHLSSGSYIADAGTAALLGCEPGTLWFRIRALRFETGKSQPLCWVDIHLLPQFAAVAKARGAERASLVEQIEQQFGERVESAELDISVSRVAPDIAAELQVKAGSPALRVVRRYTGASGDPFEVTISIHPENRYTHRIKLRKGRR